ncbi:phosphotransferase-like protein [Labrys wisconsinensis]|uniref:Chloramphenicol 3-O phosphotransferase n=1 Tax=Labrys wisconsinensis TaxID=425677 RepID=A0ABU0JGU2_9HYPH|nr:AAA family ATPase [Labrys wisconsinensis]MDQ0473516.1 chloramphenicol 3-O phosphotransferase [Labrys wisconsinensis]
MPNGRIILLNGTSSSGKSTLAKALRAALVEPFCYYASDQLADGGFRAIKQKVLDACLSDERARFFDGFHRSIVSFAEAGNDILVEHIVEEASWAQQLQALFAPLDTFWVGVHAPLAEMERRERERGDRTIGEALYHLKTHDYCRYDIEVDTTKPSDSVVSSIIEAWRARPSASWRIS